MDIDVHLPWVQREEEKNQREVVTGQGWAIPLQNGLGKELVPNRPIVDVEDQLIPVGPCKGWGRHQALHGGPVLLSPEPQELFSEAEAVQARHPLPEARGAGGVQEDLAVVREAHVDSRCCQG